MTYFNMNSSTPLPNGFSESVKRLGWSGLCKRKGCGGNLQWKEIKIPKRPNRDSGEATEQPMDIIAFQCTVVPDPELVGYKVVVSIFCVLVLVVLILRFGRPSLKAFRKKMSDRRQSRWIGPTQSQSVSYHRGKAGIQLNDKTDKRTSFPGLERLTVNNSREPSSNRNSDYDSYNL
ncbi:uncharacterized protein LOC105022896 [Esox lucius]|uniref:uncharacterized protein LOC105022896 n=1 Tax=Esox lucius TaxID=8010 RepID=UPI0014770277|nr:uncharacterized protein LOC105022896 [Esox lucius]